MAKETQSVRVPKDTLEEIRAIVDSGNTEFSELQHFIDVACKNLIRKVKARSQ